MTILESFLIRIKVYDNIYLKNFLDMASLYWFQIQLEASIEKKVKYFLLKQTCCRTMPRPCGDYYVFRGYVRKTCRQHT